MNKPTRVKSRGAIRRAADDSRVPTGARAVTEIHRIFTEFTELSFITHASHRAGRVFFFFSKTKSSNRARLPFAYFKRVALRGPSSSVSSLRRRTAQSSSLSSTRMVSPHSRSARRRARGSR